MNIVRSLTPAVLATALLLSGDLPHSEPSDSVPLPTSVGMPTFQSPQAQAEGKPAFAERMEARTLAPNDTPAGTANRAGVESASSAAWAAGKAVVLAKAATASAKFRAKARAVLKKYGCASSGIKLNDKRLGRYANGMADWYNNVVLLRSSMPAYRITYVSAHECMHMRQYRAYKGNVSKLAAAMNKIYGGKGFTGLERNADCMTRAVGIKVTNRAYASSCSGTKKTAALKILQGKRA